VSNSIAAARAGKHVFVEKPFTLSKTDAEAAQGVVCLGAKFDGRLLRGGLRFLSRRAEASPRINRAALRVVKAKVQMRATDVAALPG
jgi:hypothetical protein